MKLAIQDIEEPVRRALEEDIGGGDVTSMLTIPEEARGIAEVVTRERLTVAGLDVAATAFRMVSSDLKVDVVDEDGHEVQSGVVLMRVWGPSRAILTAERVALNFLQRLSGVASLTSRYVRAVAGTGVEILDTRKTTPGLRRLEKYAVGCGGGVNHRMGLYDMILIKDNHLAALRAVVKNPVAEAVSRARAHDSGMLVEVEADTLEQAVEAAEAGADYILLDNMSQGQLRTAVERIGGRSKIEASGGVDLASVRDIAATGVNSISVGALTHSARAMDIGLDFCDGPEVKG